MRRQLQEEGAGDTLQEEGAGGTLQEEGAGDTGMIANQGEDLPQGS
jgi:hypothetical protein